MFGYMVANVYWRKLGRPSLKFSLGNVLAP
jgi:hypothetical protein